jgi:tripartite-type tricarboxylate transporter receptor subunit TctC
MSGYPYYSPRRRFKQSAGALVLICAVLLVCPAFSQPIGDYPKGPVKIIVPYAAGGMLDSLSRYLGHALEPELGQPIIVEARPGAGGRIGGSVFSQSAPDGQTLLFATIGATTILPLIPPKLTYDPRRDFEPIAAVTQQSLLVAVRPSLSVNSFAEFVDLAKKEPGTLTFGSPGPGSEPHLATVKLLRTLGLDLIHVPYRGGGPEVIDFIGGRVDMVVLPEIALRPAIQSNQATIIATLGSERSEKFANVPTIRELGYPDVVYTMTTALFAPAKTPAPILDKWRQLLPKLQHDPGFLRALQETGSDLAIVEGKDFQQLMNADQEGWAQIISSLKLEIH